VSVLRNRLIGAGVDRAYRLVPMLAELAGLDRKSAGRVLVATIAANVDDIGSTTTTPWRVMSWEIRQDVAPHLVDGEVTALRADLDDALAIIDQLRARLEAARTKLN
jgi:cobalamin-dependent methionine synthase I